MGWIATSTVMTRYPAWMLIEDSQLIVNFMLGRNKPAKTLFNVMIRDLKGQAVKTKKKFGY